MKKQFKVLIATGIMSILSFSTVLAKTNIHFLDVGQGLSILVESQGQYMLYDGGDSDKSSFVVSYLQQQGVPALKYVIASHYDADHLNGVVGALNTFSAEQVFAPNYSTDTRVFESFNNIVSSKSIAKSQPAVGSEYQLGDCKFQILAPSGSGYGDYNDYSIAIRLQDGNKSVLITGDAEAQSEAEIVKTGLTLDSDVYVAGHHGSATSSSWDLLQKVTPEYVVISAGSGNSYGHPTADALEKFQTMGSQLYRTDKQGTINLTIENDTLNWSVAPCNDWTPGDPNDQPAQVQEQSQSSSTQEAAAIVYWTPNGKSYHNSQNCSTLKRSKTILSGTVAESGKTDPCNVCVK